MLLCVHVCDSFSPTSIYPTSFFFFVPISLLLHSIAQSELRHFVLLLFIHSFLLTLVILLFLFLYTMHYISIFFSYTSLVLALLYLFPSSNYSLISPLFLLSFTFLSPTFFFIKSFPFLILF